LYQRFHQKRKKKKLKSRSNIAFEIKNPTTLLYTSQRLGGLFQNEGGGGGGGGLQKTLIFLCKEKWGNFLNK